MIYSVAREDAVDCPRCDAEFEITPQFYHAIAECPECSTTFVIKPPGTPPYKPPRDQQQKPQKAVGTVIPTGQASQRRRPQPTDDADDAPAPTPAQRQARPAPPPPPPANVQPPKAERRPEVLDLDLDSEELDAPAPPRRQQAPPQQRREPPRRPPSPRQEDPAPAARPPATGNGHDGRPAPAPPPPPGTRPPPPARTRPPDAPAPPPRPASRDDSESDAARRPPRQAPERRQPDPISDTVNQERPEPPRRTAGRRQPPRRPAPRQPEPPPQDEENDMMSTIEFQRPEEGAADRLRQGIQQGQAEQPAAAARQPQPPARPPQQQPPARPPQPRQPSGDDEVDAARQAPANQDPRRRRQPPPPRRVSRPQQQPQEQPPEPPPERTTSSGIAVTSNENDDGNDMMSTIEIQREEGSVVDRLRQGIGEGNQQQEAPEQPAAPAARRQRRPPPRRTSSGIQAGQGMEDPNHLGTIEMQRDDGRSLQGEARSDNIRQRGGGRPQRPAMPQAPHHAPQPGAPPRRDDQDANPSGIEVQQGSMAPVGMTGTVTLSRKGMGMRQRPRDEQQAGGNDGSSPSRPRPQRRPPPANRRPPARPTNAPRPVQGSYSVVYDDHVACPHCDESYEVPQEVYGALAECPDCGAEFTIMPPGTPPPETFEGRPAPSGASAPKPQPPPQKPAHHGTEETVTNMPQQQPNAEPEKGKRTKSADASDEKPAPSGSNVKVLYGAIGVLVLLVILLVLRQLGVI